MFMYNIYWQLKTFGLELNFAWLFNSKVVKNLSKLRYRLFLILNKNEWKLKNIFYKISTGLFYD